MKKQMERTVYEAPVTELFRVELEGGFMAGSADIDNPETTDNRQGEILQHGISDDFSANATFTESGWGE